MLTILIAITIGIIIYFIFGNHLIDVSPYINRVRLVPKDIDDLFGELLGVITILAIIGTIVMLSLNEKTEFHKQKHELESIKITYSNLESSDDSYYHISYVDNNKTKIKRINTDKALKVKEINNENSYVIIIKEKSIDDFFNNFAYDFKRTRYEIYLNDELYESIQ